MSVDPRILTTITAVIDVLAAIVYTIQCGTAELRIGGVLAGGCAHFRGDMVTQI